MTVEKRKPAEDAFFKWLEESGRRSRLEKLRERERERREKRNSLYALVAIILAAIGIIWSVLVHYGII